MYRIFIRNLIKFGMIYFQINILRRRPIFWSPWLFFKTSTGSKRWFFLATFRNSDTRSSLISKSTWTGLQRYLRGWRQKLAFPICLHGQWKMYLLWNQYSKRYSHIFSNLFTPRTLHNIYIGWSLNNPILKFSQLKSTFCVTLRWNVIMILL